MLHVKQKGRKENTMSKGFWKETLDDVAVIVNGRCYHIGDEDEGRPF